VAVAAAEAERADAGASRPARRAQPGPRLRGDAERAAGQVDQRIEPREVGVGGQRLVPQRRQHLGDAGDAGRAFEVPDVGLDRADRAAVRDLLRAVFLVQARESLLQPGDLDGVAQRRAGAVRLDVVDGRGADAGRADHVGHQIGLCLRVGDGERIGAAAVVHAGRADHRMDRIAVGQRALQRLEQQHGAALAAHVAVGPLVEGAARALARQHAVLRERDEVVGRPDQVDAAGQRQFALARLQRPHRLVDRGHGGRAGGVVGDAGTPQVEEVRHAVGDDREGDAGGRVRVQVRQVLLDQLGVVPVADAHVDAGAGAGQRARRDRRVLDRPPRQFEREALLRVHPGRLARRDVEELRVEAVGVLDEAAAHAVAEFAAGRVAAQRRRVPAPRRHLGDEAAPGCQVCPQRVERLRLRQAQPRANDGNARIVAKAVHGRLTSPAPAWRRSGRAAGLRFRSSAGRRRCRRGAPARARARCLPPTG